MALRTIVNAKKGSNGNISMVLLNGNTRHTSLKTAIRMQEQGTLDAVTVTRNKKSHLRSRPDGIRQNNLDELAGS